MKSLRGALRRALFVDGNLILRQLTRSQRRLAIVIGIVRVFFVARQRGCSVDARHFIEDSSALCLLGL